MIRRSWHLLSMPLLNAVKTTLAGWKAARKPVNLALFRDYSVSFSRIFLSSDRPNWSHQPPSWLHPQILKLSGILDLDGKGLVALTSLSFMILAQKVCVQYITTSYWKQGARARILASNFQVCVLTRLFRQTNFEKFDARRSIVVGAPGSASSIRRGFRRNIKRHCRASLTSQERAEAIVFGSLASNPATWPRLPHSRGFTRLLHRRGRPEAFAVFDLNNTGIINQKNWTEAVVAIWSERRNLQLSVRMSDATSPRSNQSSE